ADQIAITWLAALHGEIQAASPGAGSLQQAAFRLKRAESSLRRHVTAVRTLATLRALFPAGLAPTHPPRLFDEKAQRAGAGRAFRRVAGLRRPVPAFRPRCPAPVAHRRAWH